MKILRHVIFCNKYISEASTNNCFLAHLSSNVRTKKELLTDLSHKVNFPNYYGYNWDALWDCIRDLSWIEENEIILTYESLPDLPDNILKLYFQLLIEATFDWESSSEHSLKIVLPLAEKNEFLNIIKDIKFDL
jgi:RNAse (barnase) inhibitor barstar